MCLINSHASSSASQKMSESAFVNWEAGSWNCGSSVLQEQVSAWSARLQVNGISAKLGDSGNLLWPWVNRKLLQPAQVQDFSPRQAEKSHGNSQEDGQWFSRSERKIPERTLGVMVANRLLKFLLCGTHGVFIDFLLLKSREGRRGCLSCHTTYQLCLILSNC